MLEPARWRALRVCVPAAGERDAVVTALIGAGAPAVSEDADGLATFVAEHTDLAALGAAVRAASASAVVTAAAATVAAWQPEWGAQVGIQRVGALVVAPPWRATEAGANAIVIEPAMAFGTGEHATTRGMLRLMQRVVRPGDLVADLGAGSAVLAIAAARLGAARVAAVECDPAAIGNAEENVARNGVGDRVHVLEGDAATLLPLLAPVRVVLANILAPVLARLEPAVASALPAGGRAIVSGVLADECAALLAVYGAPRWRLEGEDREDEWWSGILARR